MGQPSAKPLPVGIAAGQCSSAAFLHSRIIVFAGYLYRSNEQEEKLCVDTEVSEDASLPLGKIGVVSDACLYVGKIAYGICVVGSSNFLSVFVLCRSFWCNFQRISFAWLAVAAAVQRCAINPRVQFVTCVACILLFLRRRCRHFGTDRRRTRNLHSFTVHSISGQILWPRNRVRSAV